MGQKTVIMLILLTGTINDSLLRQFITQIIQQLF